MNGHHQTGPVGPIRANIRHAQLVQQVQTSQKKGRQKAALKFKLMVADQAAINTGFDFRR
jgi:hypothetical protein